MKKLITIISLVILVGALMVGGTGCVAIAVSSGDAFDGGGHSDYDIDMGWTDGLEDEIESNYDYEENMNGIFDFDSPNYNVTAMEKLVVSGPIETKEFSISEYKQIDILSNVEIIYSKEASDTIKIEGNSNIFEHITVNQEGGLVTINSDRDFREGGGKTAYPKIYISTPTLHSIDIGGAFIFEGGDSIVEDDFILNVGGAGTIGISFQVKNLEINIGGAANGTITGTADTTNVRIAGVGNLDALGLETKKADIYIAGAGTMKIHCTEDLSATIAGIGTIQYKGNPTIKKSNAGLGSITQIKE